MADEFADRLIGLLPNLKRFALSLTRAPHSADDLVQTTCEKALAARDAFDLSTRLEPWLFRIMRNAWIDRTRRVRTEGVQIDIDDAPDLVGETGRGEDRLMLTAAAAAIDALPEEQRSIVLLVCVEELSYRETAEALEIPVGTVMSRLARARKKLAADLGINEETARSRQQTRTSG